MSSLPPSSAFSLFATLNPGWAAKPQIDQIYIPQKKRLYILVFTPETFDITDFTSLATQGPPPFQLFYLPSVLLLLLVLVGQHGQHHWPLSTLPILSIARS